MSKLFPHNYKTSLFQRLEKRLHAWTEPEFQSLESKIKDLLDIIHDKNGTISIYKTKSENLKAELKASELVIAKYKKEADYLSDKLTEYLGSGKSVETEK